MLLLPAVCVTSFALAQRNSNKSSSDVERSKRPSLSDLGWQWSSNAHPVPPCIASFPHAPVAPVGVTAPTPTPMPSSRCLSCSLMRGPPTQFQTEIQAEPNVTAVDLFDANDRHSHSGSAAAIRDRCAIRRYYVLRLPDTLGNNLADYVDGGGIVVQYGFAHAGPGDPAGINGRWLTRRL